MLALAHAFLPLEVAVQRSRSSLWTNACSRKSYVLNSVLSAGNKCLFFSCFCNPTPNPLPPPVPVGSPSRGGDVAVYVCDINQPSLPAPLYSVLGVCFCLYGPFNCISFYAFSKQFSAFSLYSSDLLLPHWFFQLHISL